MSCEEPVITPGGRGGIGVVQPQSGLDYPLVAPSDDVRYLLADFYLAYDDPGFYRSDELLRQHPLRIKWLYGVGCEPAAAPGWAPAPVHDADILIVDADDNTVFDSTQLVPEGGDTEFRRFLKRNWGDNYDVYEWTGLNGVCRLVVHKTWPPSFEIAPKNWPVHLAPENAVLDERAVYKIPRRLRSLTVVSQNAEVGAVRQTGAIFAAGNNMIIANAATTTSGLRQNTNITFTAEPGAGAGKYDDCPEEPSQPIYRLNGGTPNEYGDLTLSGPDCIWIRQPTTLNIEGRAAPVRPNGKAALAIGSNCPPCCDCPDYANTALYMNRIASRYATIGKRSHEVKLLHENNIDRWAEQRECRLQKPLKVILTPQNCPFMDVVIMYCNQCQQCAENGLLTVDFSTFPPGATATVECGYTFLHAPNYQGVEFTLQGLYPTFSAPLPPVDVGNSAYVKFRLRFSPKTYPFQVTAQLSGEINDSPVRAGCEADAPFAVATASAALNCSLSGGTIRNC
jgi:hypothetical protein